MSFEDDPVIRAQLQPGESVLWTGRPSPLRAVAPHVPELLVLAIWWALAGTLIAAFLRSPPSPPSVPSETSHDADGAVLLVAALFLGAGLSGLARAVRRVLAAWRTHYALTRFRALIVVDLWPRSVQSFDPGAFRQMRRRGGDAVGTIEFGFPEQWHRRRTRPFYVDAPAFIGVAEPRHVESLIQNHLLKRPPTERRAS